MIGDLILAGVGVVVGIFVLCACFGSFFTTQQETRRVIQRLGRFKRVASPGWGWKVPFIDSVSEAVSLRTTQLPIEELTYTSAGTSVTIKGAVQYHRKGDDESVRNAFFRLAQPEAQLKTHVSSAVRNKVQTMSLEEAQRNQRDIANAVKAELAQWMDQFGYEIEDVLITAADPDATVVAANNAKYASIQAKETATNLAEAEFTKVTREAEAQKQAMISRGEGIAGERGAIFKGWQETIKDLATANVDSGEAARMVVIQNYLEMMGRLGKEGASKIVYVPSGPSAATDLMQTLATALETTSTVPAKPAAAPAGSKAPHKPE